MSGETIKKLRENGRKPRLSGDLTVRLRPFAHK